MQLVLAKLGEYPPVHSLQILGDVVDPLFHMYPFSIVHDELQPSKLLVSPSSHCSEEWTFASPHWTVQLVLAEFGDNPPVQ